MPAMYLFTLPYEVPALTTEQERLLRSLTISTEEPGSILRDFETLIDSIGEDGQPVSPKQKTLGGSTLLNLNARLSHPLDVPFKRPQQKSFPYVHALYLLARAAGLTYTEQRGSKNVLLLDADMVAAWDGLSAPEQYLNLFAAWMTRLDEEAILGSHRVDPVGPLYRCFKFMEETRDEGQVEVTSKEMEDYRYYPGFPHLALMRLFGLVGMDDGAGEKGWEIHRIEHRAFGGALISAAAARYQEVLRAAMNDVYGGDEVDWNVEALHEALRSYFPAWKQRLPLPLEGFRDGVFVFKVSLGGKVWRRIAVPATATLDALADGILSAFKFDRDHLYRFAYSDPFGMPVQINHPYIEEAPFTDEVQVGEVPLREGQTMSYIFDFGDWWEFDVLLEGIEPKQAKVDRPVVLEAHGKAPKQYHGW